MIIFNEKEHYNHFFVKNDRMFDIKSEKTLEELYQMLLNGESIKSVAEITGKKGIRDNRSVVKPMIEHTTLLANPMTMILDFNEKMPSIHSFAPFDEDDAHEIANNLLTETAKMQGTRPAIFFDKECKDFNLPLKYYDKIEDFNDFTSEDLILEIGDALNIMPNLQKKEIPYEEQKHLSLIGKDLYLPRNVINYSGYNYLPTYEEMKYYDSLPRVQKDLLRPEYDHLKFHPLFLLHLIKEKYNGLINQNELNDNVIRFKGLYNSFDYTKDNTTLSEDSFKEIVLTQKTEEEQIKMQNVQALLNSTDTLFKEKFHGRSPRVLNSLVHGYYNVYNDVTAEKIVDEFNQGNVSKIAKYNNEALLVLSGLINFNNIKESHVAILGSCLTTESIKIYIKNEFLDWYKENANKITDTDLIKFCLHTDKVDKINKNMTPKDISLCIDNYRGYQDMKKYENQYNYHFSENMVVIRGRSIVCTDGNYKMYMLKADDIRNYTVGYDTHCCQHWGGAGSSCVMKLTTEPFAGVTVIEKNGKILGQAFVWTDENKDTFVFDNMEFANDADIALYESVIAEYVKQLPYKNVHIGTGYLNGGMAGWGNKIQSSQFAKMPYLVRNEGEHVYSDYHAHNARVLKDKGRVLITPEHPVHTTIEHEETANRLLEPDNVWALQIRGKTVEEKLRLLDEVATINEWGQQKQLEWLQSAPILIKHIDNPAKVLQIWIMDNYKEYLQYIHHPVTEVIEEQLLINPEEIDEILSKNPDFVMTNEFTTKLLDSHPSLLKKLFSMNTNISIDTIKTIIRQNPYNIRTLPPRYLTDEIKSLAIELEPKIATLIDVNQELMTKAARINPNIGALMDEIPDDLQITMVTSNSGSINNIKHPCKQAVEIAIRDNPLLIRNYQFEYPELILDCIRRNHSVINVIKHPSSEHFQALGDYIPTNPYVKRDFLAWRANRENEIER